MIVFGTGWTHVQKNIVYNKFRSQKIHEAEHLAQFSLLPHEDRLKKRYSLYFVWILTMPLRG